MLLPHRRAMKLPFRRSLIYMLGTGKDRVICSCEQQNMASGIYLNESVWSTLLVGYNKKQNRRVVDLRWKKHGRIMLSEAP